MAPRLGRVVLLESDLARALKAAEMEWITRLAADLRSGVHTWSVDEIVGDPDQWPGKPGEEVPE
jgi:hypothetical protein